MKAVTALLALLVPAACATAPPADDGVRYAARAEWEACIERAQAELAAQGDCGASDCYDAAGRDLIDICIGKVGYLRHTDAETGALLREIGEGGISNLAVSEIRTYPPGHPVRDAYEKAQARWRTDGGADPIP
jgi:hypothetical protein